MNNNLLCNAIHSCDWEFENDDTQYLTHNIHRYSGKFIPQIANKAINLITEPEDIILDSYAGSGTTLLEAMILKRHSIGIDLNPLAVLISKVKTTIVSNDDLNEIYSGLIPFIDYLLLDGQLFFSFDMEKEKEQYNKNSWRLEDAWYCKWFQPDVLEQLVHIFSYIETISNQKAKNIALVAFSNILRRSSNASSKYPNVMYDKNLKKKQLPAKQFLDSLQNILSSVIQLSQTIKTNTYNAKIYLHNNLSLPMENESIDAIITHPPYIAAVPYAEYGVLSLTWLGYNSKKIDEELTGGKRQSSLVVPRFIKDYKGFFTESYRVLKPGKYMFLMVGNPTSHGEIIDLKNITVDFAQQSGFSYVTMETRHGQNRRGNKMGEEYVIFLQKPLN